MAKTAQKLYDARQATQQLKVTRRGTWYSIYLPNGDDAYVSNHEDGATERVRGKDALKERLLDLGYEPEPLFGYYSPATQD